MHQPQRFCLAFLSLLFLIVPASHAAGSLRVDESRTKVELRDRGIFVWLAVENPGAQSVRAHVEVEFIDPKGSSCGRDERDQAIPAGSSKIRFEVPIPKFQPADLDTVFWYRLRYTLSPSASERGSFDPVSGIASVSEVAPDMFELHLAYPEAVRWGAPLEAVVRAVQPVTLRPVSGVKLQATLEVSDSDSRPDLKASATTDSRGYARLQFVLPANSDTSDPTLEIKGQLGGYTATLSGEELHTYRFSKFLLSTDKSLYQPGQTLHARILALGPDHHAVANAPLELRIVDLDDTLVFRASLKTSRFGIASVDWPIPANQRLGTYSLQSDFSDDDSEEGTGSASIKISRYDLPNFAVTVKPDRSFYLPGQNAEVAVHADYLFGKPVSRGHVRVVRETDRSWNYHDQKWDIDEGPVYEGDTDSSGQFLAKIDLSDDHKDLSGADYIRFRDLRYTAYFTDPSSRRTEERTFDLRVTKQPIHVYVVQAGLLAGTREANFYVSTSYADGSPASCNVSIGTPDTTSPDGFNRPAQPLRSVRTNRYGVAKVFGFKLPPAAANDIETPLVFRATDDKGAGGIHTEDFYSYGSPSLLVATDKALYRPGDPIEVKLVSDQPDAFVEVEAIDDLRFIASQVVHLRHGHASLTFPPNDRFEGPITISAYELGLHPSGQWDESAAQGSWTVLFPHDTSLNLDLHTSKAEYRPGEEARIDFHVSSPDGDTQKSALGVVVVDKAVEERERTDADLVNGYGFYAFREYWESPAAIAGIRLSDLDKVDLSKPLPDGLDLVAEILLQQGGSPSQFDDTSGTATDLHTLFASEIDPPLHPVMTAVQAKIGEAKSPGGDAGIRRFLEYTQLPSLHDPWGTLYRVDVRPVGANYLVKVQSAGPDKTFGTADDFDVASTEWPYFAQYSLAIEKVAGAYHARTGNYIRDAQTLKSELLAEGIDFDSLRDPWGHPYRLDFGIERDFYTIEARSAGPDGQFSPAGTPYSDDVIVSRNISDYFEDTRQRMNAALDRYYHDTDRFPQNEKELSSAFGAAKLDWQSLRDPWGHPYYVTFRQEARYSDTVNVQTYADYQAGQHTTIHPVTSEINFIDIRSGGPDGAPGTPDDFEAAMFSRAVYASGAAEHAAANFAIVYSGESGAIAGTVTDPSGAAVAGARITATRSATGEVYQATSGPDGGFTLANLRPGLYEVHFVATGFNERVITAVPVGSSAVTQLNATVQVGSVSQTVTVEARVNGLQTQTSTASVAARPNATSKSAQVKAPAPLLSTPRLREYFPETLLWQPELVTDSRGTAHLNFPLADSITTWSLAVIASTTDGRIGTAEKEVRAFQPFFADQDLPQFLTAGDEIGLPVIVRNYLDRAEQMQVKVDPEPWLTLLGPSTRTSELGSNDSARLIFPMRAIAAVKDGKQRVAATSGGASDAIEKKTRVRPFGEERIAGVSQMLANSAVLNLSIPENTLPGSVEAELKIYPNLMAHVWEAIEAILERPYGCGEQTISSTYPSILLMRYAKQTGREDSPEVAKARHFAQLGYDRLLSYQSANGAFTYWGRNDAPDLALTAYALMFLHDARDVIPVDDSVARKAQSWLLDQAKPDGHWVAQEYWSEKEDSSRSALITAYIARVLAETKSDASDDSANPQLAARTSSILANSFAWLEPRARQLDEPYLIASYALGRLASGNAADRAAASEALEKLRSIAHAEGDTAYWSLEMNTPFYGWGRAGRLETTALVLEALERAANFAQPADRSLIDRATLFLLRNQDRYGIWYSSQATINVLRALALSVSGPAAAPPPASVATVLVDGKPAATVPLPSANQLSAPVTADLSKFLPAGDHRVEITRPDGAPEASVQLAETYYVPWAKDGTEDAASLHREKDSAEALRLAVTYDKTSAKIGERITCTVKAERVDFRGYGMMLAEIGLPPGAEVDRATLDDAMKSSGWSINQFDVLPDRVIVYLWPRAGGTTFSFAFTTRFAINAETTPSTLYDYYNPDARAVVMPTRLTAQ